MQKVKIILVNLILFLILFHVVDFYCSTIGSTYSWLYKDYRGIKLLQYIKEYTKIHWYSIKFNKEAANKLILTDNYGKSYDVQSESGAYRPIENKNAENAILLFGCSVTYGIYLTNQETFSYRLGKYLPNYAIYNRAQSGWSTSHMLYQLQNKDFSNIKNIKYVIYVFINDHIFRNYNSYLIAINPYYKINTYGGAEFQTYTTKNILNPISLYKNNLLKNKMLHGLYSKVDNKTNEYAINLTKSIILTSKDVLDYAYKAPKFIVLRYDKGKEEPYDYMFEDLKKAGITVLSVNDLSTTDYNTIPYQISKTDRHPNAKAWKEITPLFVKYMQDRGYLKG